MSNSEKIRFNRFMKICWRVIVDNYIVDCLKAPAPNPPKPALLSAASFNIYFSQNMSKSEDGKFVFWNGYGLGSGTKTIGLDQWSLHIYPFFPQLINLLSLVREIIGRSFPDLYCFFDTISVKGYWCYPTREAERQMEKWQQWKQITTGTLPSILMENQTKTILNFLVPLWLSVPGVQTKSLFFRDTFMG